MVATIVGSAGPDNIRRNVAWLNEELDKELLAAERRSCSQFTTSAGPAGTRRTPP